MKKVAFILIVVFAASISFSGNTVVTATSTTLQSVINNAGPFTTIKLNGNYSGNIVIQNKENLIIEPYSGISTISTSSGNCFFVDASSNILIRNFYVNVPSNGTGILITATGSSIRVEHCVLIGTYMSTSAQYAVYSYGENVSIYDVETNNSFNYGIRAGSLMGGVLQSVEDSYFTGYNYGVHTSYDGISSIMNSTISASNTSSGTAVYAYGTELDLYNDLLQGKIQLVSNGAYVTHKYIGTGSYPRDFRETGGGEIVELP